MMVKDQNLKSKQFGFKLIVIIIRNKWLSLNQIRASNQLGKTEHIKIIQIIYDHLNS